MSASTRSRGATSYQRHAHTLLSDAGYEWERSDGKNHNHYRNQYGQKYVVVGTPTNPAQELKVVAENIRRHTKERQEFHVKQQTEPSLTDQLVAMADPFMLKKIDPNKREQVLARAAAFDKWLRRVLEKHGPLHAAVLEEASERVGFVRANLHGARKRIGAVAYREKNVWMVCLEYQLPPNKQARTDKRRTEVGVSIEAPEPTYPNEASLTGPIESVPLTPLPATNGKHEVTDQQAAFLMLAEQLGMKMPGDEAKAALQAAERALDDAHAALSAAIEALA